MNMKVKPARPHTGRDLLQVPGPTNVPQRAQLAMAESLIDHRGREFKAMFLEILDRLGAIFQTSGRIAVFVASGTGAAEATLVNVLSPHDRVLMFDSGFFAHAWIELARRLGYDVQVATADWGRGIDAEAIEQHLVEDPNHRYRAVAMVHNETSTGVTSPVTAVRAAIDAARHPALLLVDAISSLGSMDYHHDEWGVDVTITSSQKGLMLPPGLSFLALSEKAFAASKTACTPTGYWDWHTALDAHASGLFPYTPATSLLFGLRETTEMLLEEGLINVFARHARLGEATRAAASAWGLDIVCTHPERASNTVTAVRVPERYDADRLRSRILQRSNVALGAGLGRLASTTFRIGHLGDINDAMLLGALGAVETGLAECGIPQHLGGTQAALHSLIAAQTGIEHDNKKARRR